MSRRIEWTTTQYLQHDIYDRGQQVDSYDEPVTEEVGLFLGSGRDGLIIEGTAAGLAAKLRELADRVERHGRGTATTS
jgi:hypothetical protein